MTHFRSKSLPSPGVALAAIAGLVAALGLGATGEARAAEPARAEMSTPAAARWA